jgi:hypothetical protein
MSSNAKYVKSSSKTKEIRAQGAVNVSTLGWRSFMAAATFIERSIFTRVPEDELRKQYREFCRTMEEVSRQKRSVDLSSKQLLSMLFDPNNMLYKDIEGVLSVLAKACVTSGVEAIVESWVSVLEGHSSSVRGITNQQRLEDELWVALNGPEVVHCEGVVKEAIRVGEGGGHFIRRSENIKSYNVSKAVDSIVSKTPKLSFMM